MNYINKSLTVGIIGCGLIGGKRADAIKKLENLKYCSDIDKQKG